MNLDHTPGRKGIPLGRGTDAIMRRAVAKAGRNATYIHGKTLAGTCLGRPATGVRIAGASFTFPLNSNNLHRSVSADVHRHFARNGFDIVDGARINVHRLATNYRRGLATVNVTVTRKNRYV